MSGLLKSENINALTKTNFFISDDLSVGIIAWELGLGGMLIAGVWLIENMVLTLLSFMFFLVITLLVCKQTPKFASALGLLN